MTEGEFERIVEEMRVKMQVPLQEASLKFQDAHEGASLAMEYAKAGVGIAAFAVAQIYRANMNDDAVMAQICIDIATHIKIAARAPDNKAPHGSFKFLERLHKRGLQ